MNVVNQKTWIRSNWFFLVAPIVIAFDITATKMVGWSPQRSLEAALLFDFVIQLPLLYVMCYWSQGKQAVVRAVAMGCFSIWLVGQIVPVEQQQILGSVGWLRYVGLVGLVIVEIKVIVFVWKSLFSGNKTAESATRELTNEGTPEWVSRLLVAEGMFWKRLWRLVCRLFGRN